MFFILPILIVVTAVLTVFGVIQVRFEEDKLIDDVGRKSRSIAESMEISVKHVLENNDLKTANYLVEKFQTRERLQGCVIYDKNGEVFAITRRFLDWKEKNKSYLSQSLAAGEPRGGMERFKEYTVYSYVLPIFDDGRKVIGLVEVIHDTSFVFSRLAELWKRISGTLVVLLVLILWISIFIHKQIFVLPVLRLTE